LLLTEQYGNHHLMNVNANGIVAVNNGKKDDSPSLPSSGLRNFYGRGVSGDDNSHSPHQSVTKSTGAVLVRQVHSAFENHLMLTSKLFVRNRTTAADSRHSSNSKDLRLLRLRS
jgi:hypothetical protein